MSLGLALSVVTDRLVLLESCRFHAERTAAKSWNCNICTHDVTETRRRALYLDGDRQRDDSWLDFLD